MELLSVLLVCTCSPNSSSKSSRVLSQLSIYAHCSSAFYSFHTIVLPRSTKLPRLITGLLCRFPFSFRAMISSPHPADVYRGLISGILFLCNSIIQEFVTNDCFKDEWVVIATSLWFGANYWIILVAFFKNFCELHYMNTALTAVFSLF